MRDKEIFALFMTVLLPAVQLQAGLETLSFVRNYQSSQQGAATTPRVYFTKLPDHRYGFTGRKDLYDPDEEEFVHTETQIYESTFQFMAEIPQTPADVNSLTESDVLNTVAGVLQSEEIVSAFQNAGVGIQRITGVRNDHIKSDRDEFEVMPSFDIVLSYTRELISTVPIVNTYEANFGRV